MKAEWWLFPIIWAFLSSIIKGEELQWHLFHQTDYNIKIHRLEAQWINRSYFSDFKLDYTLSNRTHRAFTGQANLLVDITNDIRMDVQLYKMMSNEYRFFPVTVSLEMCKEAERNSFGLKTSMQKTCNANGCPLKKGHYYCRNTDLDYSRFPPYMPYGHYKMTLKIYHKEDYLGESDSYYEIAEKPLLPIP